MAAENDKDNQNDTKNRCLSIKQNIFSGNLQENSISADTNQKVVTENDNHSQNRRIFIENDFLKLKYNVKEVQTGYYRSNVKNDDFFNKDSSLYKSLQENIDINNCHSDSVPALNFELELFNMNNDLDEAIHFQQYTTDLTALEPILTINPTPISLELRQIRKGIRYVSTWDGLLAYLSLHGRVLFNKDQCKILGTTVINASSGVIKLHHVNIFKSV